MRIEIDPAKIQSAIQEHLDNTVKEGIDYRVKSALDAAIADAITPDIVSGYAAAAMQALTDPAVTQRVIVEMQNAIAEAVKMTLQEAIVSVVCRMRGYQPGRNREDEQKLEAVRERLFPTAPVTP